MNKLENGVSKMPGKMQHRVFLLNPFSTVLGKVKEKKLGLNKCNLNWLILRFPLNLNNRSDSKGNYYIRRHSTSYELFVEEKTLNLNPTPNLDNLFNSFFQLIHNDATGNSNQYTLIEPAVIDWDERTNSGRLKTRGIIGR